MRFGDESTAVFIVFRFIKIYYVLRASWETTHFEARCARFFREDGFRTNGCFGRFLLSGVGINFNFAGKIGRMYCTNAVLLLLGNLVTQKGSILCEL